MSNKCSYVLANGQPCRRWALRGQGFCPVHQPDPPPIPYDWRNKEKGATHRYSELDVAVPALARLATPRDLFDVIREAINAVRLGRISPGQAYAINALAAAWTKARNQLNSENRDCILRGQMLPALAEEERLAEEELLSSEPLAPPPAHPPVSATLDFPVPALAHPPASASPVSPAPIVTHISREQAVGAIAQTLLSSLPASIPDADPIGLAEKILAALIAASPNRSSVSDHPSHSAVPVTSSNGSSASTSLLPAPASTSAPTSTPASPSEISNLKSAPSPSSAPTHPSHATPTHPSQPGFQQVDLVAAHKRLAAYMGWVPDDGSDLHPIPESDAAYGPLPNSHSADPADSRHNDPLTSAITRAIDSHRRSTTATPSPPG